MAGHFTIRDLERLAALEQGRGACTSNDEIGYGTSQLPPPKSDIRRDVYTIVAMQTGWVTRGQVAKLLGLKRTGWLNAAIEELVTAGYLDKYVEQRPNQLPVYFYRVRR